MVKLCVRGRAISSALRASSGGDCGAELPVFLWPPSSRPVTSGIWDAAVLLSPRERQPLLRLPALPRGAQGSRTCWGWTRQRYVQWLGSRAVGRGEHDLHAVSYTMLLHCGCPKFPTMVLTIIFHPITSGKCWSPGHEMYSLRLACDMKANPSLSSTNTLVSQASARWQAR